MFPYGFDAATAGRGHGLFARLGGGDKNIVARTQAGGILLYKKDAAAIGRLLKTTGFHPFQVATFLVMLADALNLLICPGQGEKRQPTDRQQNRPGKTEQGAQQGKQAFAGAKPDHHFTIAVNAGEGGDDGNKQPHRGDVGQEGQHGVTHHHHHIRRVEAAARGLAQGANEGHGHDNRDQHNEGGTETARQLFADGGME